MLSLLLQLAKTEDEVCFLVNGLWFEGQIMQADNEIVLLHNCKGQNGAYYTTAIRIDAIDSVQFTTDFRPNRNGALLNKKEIEDNT